MSDLAKAYVQIIPSAKGIGTALSDEIGPAAESAGSSAGSKIGSLIKSAIITAGIGTALKAAISEGMELEQNLGGTEAVFGEFADSIQTKAQEAYMNMGMSASDYMATANKMGSLFQGSGLEQQRALDLTSEAMQRAADVASVMGLDMESAMESIAGAAKGNFTMMDNLGVSMNATTLQAYALEKGINFKWDTASNAEKAELAMQMFFERTEQYAGNFARESAETLSGSLGAVQSALKNVLGNLALGNDIKPSLEALKDTAINFIKGNLLPTVTNVLSALPSALLDVVIALGPELIRQAANTISTIVSGLAAEMPTLVPQLVDAVMGVLTNITAYLPDLLLAGAELIAGLCKGVMEGLGSLGDLLVELLGTLIFDLTGWVIPDILGVVADLASTLASELPGVIQSLLTVIPEIINSLVDAVSEDLPKIAEAGFSLLTALVTELPAAILEIIAAIPDIVGSICSALMESNPLVSDSGVSLITSMVSDLPVIIDQVLTAVADVATAILDLLIDNIPTFIDTGVELLTSIVGNLPTIIQSITAALPQVIDSIVQKLSSLIPKIVQAGVTLLVSLVKNLPAIIAGIVKVIPSLISAVLSAIGSFLSGFKDLGKNLLLGLADGIAGAVSSVVKKAKEAASKILNSVKDFFGIKSPSRLFKNDIGRNLMLGLAEGIEGNTKEVSSAIDEVTRMTASGFTSDLQIGVSYGSTRMDASTFGAAPADETTYLLRQAVSLLQHLPALANMQLTLDGREVGRGLVPYLDEQLAL